MGPLRRVELVTGLASSIAGIPAAGIVFFGVLRAAEQQRNFGTGTSSPVLPIAFLSVVDIIVVMIVVAVPAAMMVGTLSHTLRGSGMGHVLILSATALYLFAALGPGAGLTAFTRVAALLAVICAVIASLPATEHERRTSRAHDRQAGGSS